MYRFCAVILLLPLLVRAGNIVHHPCTNSYPAPRPPVPTWVRVEGCDSSACSVPNGAIRTLRCGFYPQSSHHRLHGVIRAFMFGVEFAIEQPAELSRLCDHLVGGCPLVAGSGERIGVLRINGKSPVSGVTVRVEVSVMDTDTNQCVACAGADVTII